MTPPEVIDSFISTIPDERDRVRIVGVCAYPMEKKVVTTDAEAKEWLAQFLSYEPKDHLRHFARVLWLATMLDFELAPQNLSRAVETNRAIIEDQSFPDDGLKRVAADTIAVTIPRLHEIGERWRDLRRNELDEASLWIYRDGLRRAKGSG